MIVLALTLFSCAKSPEEKARTLFEESIKPRMGNPDLYEYMQMTDLDSAYSSLSIDDRNYLALKDSLKKNKTTIFDAFSKNYKVKEKKEKALEQEIKDYEESFVQQDIGWHSIIEFRAENLFFFFLIYKADAYFNDELTKYLDWFLSAE